MQQQYTKETGATYEGTKQIRAWPMDRLTYNRYRGWTLPGDENGDDAGYMVEYLGQAGNKPNHADHEGYISWSPADVFENSYKPLAPEDWVTRLIAERDQLTARLDKLRQFLASDKADDLEEADRQLLHEQGHHMSGYAAVLSRRIERIAPAFGQTAPGDPSASNNALSPPGAEGPATDEIEDNEIEDNEYDDEDGPTHYPHAHTDAAGE